MNVCRRGQPFAARSDREKRSRPLALATLLGVVLACGMATGSRAGDPDESGVDYYAQLSCDQLWYERNAIYARHGYCFKKPRAIATFGRGCKPPFGQLPGNLQNVVRDIQAWEKRRGCR